MATKSAKTDTVKVGKTTYAASNGLSAKQVAAQYGGKDVNSAPSRSGANFNDASSLNEKNQIVRGGETYSGKGTPSQGFWEQIGGIGGEAGYKEATAGLPAATPEIDVSQPNPSAVEAQPYQSKEFTQNDPNDPTLTNDRGEKVDFSTYTAQGGKADFSNVRKAWQQAAASGQPAPQDAAAGRAMAQGLMPPQGPNSALIDQTLAEDPGMAELLASRAEFVDQMNQRTSLTDDYAKLTKQMGIPALNTELMNMKNIIDGTEEDIRNEVTKAGGFATESQVQALTFARNKGLVKNYNNLLETKQMAMEQLNMMVNLRAQDRQFAMQSIQTKLQLDTQIVEYRDKMRQNAVAGYERIVSRSGYDGLAEMTNGDPYYTAMVERTLGLGTGGLSKLAAQDASSRQAAQAQQDFENSLKVEQLNLSKRSNAISAGNLGLAQQKFQYEQEKDLMDYIDSGGVPPEVRDKVVSSNDYKIVSGVLPAVQTIKNYKTLFDQYGTVSSGEARGKLDAAYGDAVTAWKTLAGLGALSGADFGLADNVIPKASGGFLGGVFKSDAKVRGRLDGALNTAISNAESYTQRLLRVYPQAAPILDAQLDDIRVKAYPDRYKVGPDGKVYEIQ